MRAAVPRALDSVLIARRLVIGRNATLEHRAGARTSTSHREDRGVFGSVILDVAIGLVLIYFLLSLIASALREAIEGFVKSRAVHLERGIRAMLDDPRGEGAAARFYRHPLISSLYQSDFTEAPKRFNGRNLPAYIPARNFAGAVIDMAVRRPVPSVYAGQQTSSALTMEALHVAVKRIDSPFVQRALRAAVDAAQGDVTRVQANLEAWYDSAMDRVSGWYKRRTQWILLAIGFGSAVVIDVDTVRIAQHLYRSPASRAAAVSVSSRVIDDGRRADSMRTATVRIDSGALDATMRARRSTPEIDPRTALATLDSLQLPILWRNVPMRVDTIIAYSFHSLLGWLITALAVSLGAPFWFDMLNKIMVIRSTVKPREKSQDEGSEDRQPKGADRRSLADQARLTTAAVTAATAGMVAANGPHHGSNAESFPPVDPPHPLYAPHEWADGPEDGIL